MGQQNTSCKTLNQDAFDLQLLHIIDTHDIVHINNCTPISNLVWIQDHCKLTLPHDLVAKYCQAKYCHVKLTTDSL